MIPKLLCATGIVLLLFTATAQAEIWLDQSLSNWNQPSVLVPQAPSSSSDFAVRCKAQVRSPENLLDQALAGAGWIPFGAIQNYGSTFIITAMSGADAECRPLGYQAFVFSEGKVAGTVSPALMNSEMDGSIHQIRLINATAVEVDFSRVGSTNSSRVRFEIRQSATGHVLVPLEISHAKEVLPEAAISKAVPETPVSVPEILKRPEVPTPKESPVVVQEAHPSFLEPISNPRLLKGCGCFFKSTNAADPDDPYVFLTNIRIEKRAWVNIAREERSLNMLRSTRPDDKKFRVTTGYEFQEEYGAGDLHIIADYVVRKLPGAGESFAEYEAKLNITAGERKETVLTSGVCGCMKH
jgi:hypothetical protein